MRLHDLVEVQFADGTVKECVVKEVENYVGNDNRIIVEQRKFTVEEVKRFSKD